MNRFWVAIFAGLVIAPAMAFASDARDALVDIQVQTAEKVNSQQDMTLSDGLARVYQVKGKAFLIKQDSPQEMPVKVGDEIKMGDVVYTLKGASVSIAFDYLKKNAVQIPQESKAFFQSIEPTDIKLESGSVFSAVDGLPQGSTWKVTTPSAVAAVRGTVYLVRFETASGEFYAATVDVPDDGKDSAIDIQLIEGDGEAFVPEGKEITLREGEPLSSDLVQDLSPEAIAQIKQFFEQLKEERESAEEEATKENETSDKDGNSGSDNFGDNDPLDTTGPSLGENLPELDPLEDFKGSLAEEKKDDKGHHYENYGTNY